VTTGYRFDYLVAEMPCPGCGAISPADGSTEMITRLRDEPSLAYLGVGDALPADPARARQAGYLVLRDPRPGEDVVLLHTWVCPACGQSFLWARVRVREGRIASIEPVELNAASVASANYVVDDAKWIAAELEGLNSPLSLSDEQAAGILRDKLT
jgi:predicted RNA-binding Zn-ribbon protein involved in translation (DUF1610 family)